jgi:Cytosine deaminase and related metal-dependent hydrolases
MGKLIIRNCEVMTFEGQVPRFLPGQDILIEGNQIIAIQPTAALAQSDCQVIDATGMLAVPGMVNTHAHVPMVLFRNAGPDVNENDWFNKVIFPLEANLTPEDVYWGAMLGMAEMIAAGITCVADHYFEMDMVAQAVEKAGIRANLGWAVFGHQGYAQLDETIRFVERWQGKADGRITTWLAPHSPYLCDPDFLARCAQEAAHLGVGNHIHAAETAGQVTLSLERYGKTPIQLLADAGMLEQPTIIAHCLYPSDADLDLLVGREVGIAQAPKTYLAMAMGLADLPKYLEKRIAVGLATDGVVSSSTLDLFEQMRLTALTQKNKAMDAEVMPVNTVLDLAFQGGAKVLRQPRLGNLKAGNLADVVLLRQDRPAVQPVINKAANLVYSLDARDVDTVICDGELIYQGGKHLTLDLEEILREVNSRLPRLLNKDLSRKIADYPG